MPQARITKQELEEMPVAAYTGSYIVVSDEAQATAAVEALRSSGCILGFDTETRPSFQKGVSYRVALVQLSAGHTCFLFRLHRMQGLSAPLKALLEDPAILKVGLSTHDDFSGLRKWDNALRPQGFIDVQHIVRHCGIEEMSLSKIYALLFRRKLSKRQRLTNWEAETLTDKQMAYASLDAVACVEIYDEVQRLVALQPAPTSRRRRRRPSDGPLAPGCNSSADDAVAVNAPVGNASADAWNVAK